MTDLVPPRLPYLLPWVRVALLIRSIRATIFDEATWPTAKTVLARALAMRSRLARQPPPPAAFGRRSPPYSSKAEAPELALFHRWLDNWHGVGLLAVGLHRAGYDLELRQYGDGHWRATFYVTGIAHSILGGSAWEPTVWRAVQQAGWDALQHAERNL